MYDYKITLRAPHARTTIATGRGNVQVKHTESDTANITHYLYGQRNIEAARSQLRVDLPFLRKRAGVLLTEKDVNMGFESKMFHFDRIGH